MGGARQPFSPRFFLIRAMLNSTTKGKGRAYIEDDDGDGGGGAWPSQ